MMSQTINHHLNVLPAQVNMLNTFVHSLVGQFHQIKSQSQQIRTEIQQIRTEFQQIGTEFQQIRTEFQQIGTEFQQIGTEFQQIGTEFQQIGTMIQRNTEPLCEPSSDAGITQEDARSSSTLSQAQVQLGLTTSYLSAPAAVDSESRRVDRLDNIFSSVVPSSAVNSEFVYCHPVSSGENYNGLHSALTGNVASSLPFSGNFNSSKAETPYFVEPSSTACSTLQHIGQPAADAPQFHQKEPIHAVTANRKIIKAEFRANVGGSFYRIDKKWICSVRSHLSVWCSLSLRPWPANIPLYLQGYPTEVQSICMSISAIDAEKKTIWKLIQYANDGHEKPIQDQITFPCPSSKDENTLSVRFTRLRFPSALRNYHLVVELHAGIGPTADRVDSMVRIARQESDLVGVRGRAPQNWQRGLKAVHPMLPPASVET
jgi:archaellum component FlaC